jgi:hypothetical protein
VACLAVVNRHFNHNIVGTLTHIWTTNRTSAYWRARRTYFDVRERRVKSLDGSNHTAQWFPGLERQRDIALLYDGLDLVCLKPGPD